MAKTFTTGDKDKAAISIRKAGRVLKKILKALEKARRAKARKRKKELREKREAFLKPYYSEITGRRYKTEKGMKRAEEKYKIKYWDTFYPKIVLDAEATLTRNWSSLGHKKNVWPHKYPRGPMRLIFYDIQGNDWDNLYENSIREAYRREGLDKKMQDGHSLRDFITQIMGIENTYEIVDLADYNEEENEIEVDFS